MSVETILIILAIGAISGWLGSILFKGSGLGLPGNIIVGILGSFVGSWLFRELKISIGTHSIILNAIITGAVGAFVILFLVSLLSGRRS